MPTPPTPTPTPTLHSAAEGGAAMQRRRQLLHNVESLRGRVRQVLNCVINLHIEFLVLESDVAALLDEVRCLNEDYAEVQRLDRLIEALRDYSGPTICHEWPYPLILKGTIDEAHVAQILNNTAELVPHGTAANNAKGQLLKHAGIGANELTTRRSKLLRFMRTRSTLKKAKATIAS